MRTARSTASSCISCGCVAEGIGSRLLHGSACRFENQPVAEWTMPLIPNEANAGSTPARLPNYGGHMRRAMVECICQYCGTVFDKPEYDVVRRGWGRFCSLSCTASGTNPTKKRKGEQLSRSSARRVARALWIQRHGCDPVCRCGKPADVHHKDGDMHNNDEANHEPLCRSHHVSLENRLKPRRVKKAVALGCSQVGKAPSC